MSTLEQDIETLEGFYKCLQIIKNSQEVKA
jgi:hypothetical protein